MRHLLISIVFVSGLFVFASPARAGDATRAQADAAERTATEPAAAAGVEEAAEPTLVSPRPRQGYYLSLGMLGVMNANRDEDAAWLPTWPGWSSAIRIGEALNDNVTVGLSFGYGQTQGKKRAAQSGGLGLEVGYIGFEPWAVRASVGLAFTGVGLRQGDEEDDIDGRFGELYTVSVSRAFVPFYDGGSGALAISPIARVELGPDDMFTYLAFSVGVEVSWWLGLPRNQLALDIEEAYADD